MPVITIDNRPIEVPAGSTILDAARRLGIDVPTLCHLEPYEPSTSCLACVVKIRGQNRFVPSCATLAVDGMEVESETPEVHNARRMALELLASDHLGDCLAPGQLACPLHVDIPQMLRQIRDGRFDEAIATIRRDAALPAVLARVCGRPCEKACRRAAADGPVAICSLKAQVAEFDLASATPYSPPRRDDTLKRVAIVGAGPCGLSAAFHLAVAGHRVTLFDEQSRAGGRLRRDFDQTTLPAAFLDAEIAQILRLGIELRLENTIGDKSAFDRLRRSHDAVLVACGAAGKDRATRWGLAVTDHGIQVDKSTHRASADAVFAAGDVTRAASPVVRSAADGKAAAAAIDAFLTGSPAAPARPPWTVHYGRLAPEEMALLVQLADTSPEAPPAPAAGAHSPPELARREAARCLHCDCRARETCRLKHYAEKYDARPAHYHGTRRQLVIDRTAMGLIYEPGKCIDCGLCIQVAATRRDLAGLSFIGRGFDVRVGVPLDHPLDEALADLAAACAAVCPTGALAMGDEPRPSKTESRL